jgi:hypothetical protein
MEYSDPPNVDEIILNFPTDVEDILSFIDNKIPGWIVYKCPQYSVELHRFNLEWAETCLHLKVRPKQVVLVKDCFLATQKSTHKLIKKIIQSLLESGYSVMDVYNFNSCQECGNVIVSALRMIEKEMVFSGKCQGCFRYDPRKKLT